MKMKRTLFLGWLLVAVLLLSGQAPLKDNPSKGEWRFSPEKIWEVDKAGDNDFGRVAELLVLDDGRVCLRDFGKNISYLFDGNGRFVKTFAPQGKEDGQLPFYLNRFRAGGKIVLAAPDKLHFFSSDGVFERAVPNDLFQRFPLSFIGEDEFICAPNFPRSPVQERKLTLVDLKTGQDRVLVDFSGPGRQGETAPPGPMLMIFGLTPQVRFAAEGGRMFFGRSDRYEIFVADRSGRVLSSFGLDRERLTASLEDKRKQIAGTRIPDDQKEKIIAQLPSEMTFFSHIEAIKGLVYVFAVNDLEQRTGSQRVDIFSETGEYLYRGRIGFGEGLEFGSPANILLTDGYAYVVLVNGQGKQTLAKYRIKLPR
jgi:hypothetical protein